MTDEARSNGCKKANVPGHHAVSNCPCACCISPERALAEKIAHIFVDFAKPS